MKSHTGPCASRQTYKKLSEWGWVGSVGKPYGLQGTFMLSGRKSLLPGTLIQVCLLPPDPQYALSSYGADASPKPCWEWLVESHKLHRHRDILTLHGVTSRTDLESLRGWHLWAPLSAYALWCKRRHGAQVCDAQGQLVGAVWGFPDYGSGPLVEIQLLTSVGQGRALVPMVRPYMDLDAFESVPHLLTLHMEALSLQAWVP